MHAENRKRLGVGSGGTVALLLALALLLPALPAAADVIGGVLPGGGVIRSPVRSWEALKFEHVVRQHTDFSCGAASVATILKYAYGRQVTESQVLRGMLKTSNEKIVRSRGFSLYDIQQYVEKRLGMRGVGYRVGLDKLLKVRIPVIVLLDLGGYKHFVVLRHATATHVSLADPALGNRTVKTSRFQQEWNGIIFAIIGKGYRPHNPLIGTPVLVGAGEMVAGHFPAMGDLVNSQVLRFTGANPSQTL